jgi:hypothetical protein
MLCASGFEFEEKLRAARAEQESAQRTLKSDAELDQSSSKRFELAAKRYDRTLADFASHKRECTLCRGS